MKHNYTIRIAQIIISILLFFVVAVGSSQNIKFTFENAQNTNDGTNDFYEADIMIQTIDGQADFKLGSGQIYFNYNTLAFGEWVKTNSMFTTSQDNASGYICGQYIDAFAADIYSGFVVNDNTASRVSWAFSQTFSESTFATDNITATATKLIHIKFQYIDVNEDPMVAFENDNGALDQATDQFFTACGSTSSGAFDSADCTNVPGVQFVGATFDNNAAVLATSNYQTDIVSIELYPNPSKNFISINGLQEKATIIIYDLNGKMVLQEMNYLSGTINISHLQIAMYMVKITTDKNVFIKKLVKN